MKSWTKDGICWPYDLLPLALPDSRILTWGYDSSIIFFVGKRQTTHLSLSDYAKNLLYDINDTRLDTPPTRPLIFISHGLGGVIVKNVCLCEIIQIIAFLFPDRQLSNLK